MTETARKTMKTKRLFLFLPLAVLLTAGLAFVACTDTGDSPTPPLSVGDITDEILFDDPRPGVTARVSPSTVTTPDPVTELDAETTLVGVYRDPGGMPVEGLQMNFTADPVNPFIIFNPPASFTDSNGAASTRVVVQRGVLSGSVILVAYTSPASAGPNARGQTTLWVNQGEVVSAPETPSGLTSPPDEDNTAGVIVATNILYTTTGSTSSLFGDNVQYRFDCNGVIGAFLAPGVTSDTCNFNGAGTSASFLVRAQAISTASGVTSEWSPALTVTITDAN